MKRRGLDKPHRAKPEEKEGQIPETRPLLTSPGEPAKESSKRVTLTASGKVIDAAGKPVAGASVYLREWSTLRSSEEPYSPNDILAATQTGQRGQFTFLNVPAKPSLYREFTCPWDVVAVAKGYGLGWQHLRTPKEDRSLTVQLPPEATIRGHVVNKAGEPIPRANVRVFFVNQLGSEYYLGDFNAPGRLDLQRSRLAPNGTTDAEGNVTIGGLPPEVRLWLTVEDDSHAPVFPFVATTRAAQPDVRVSRYDSDGSKATTEKVFALVFPGRDGTAQSADRRPGDFGR